MVFQCFIVTVRPGEDDGLVVFFFPLTLPVWVQQPPPWTVGGVQTRTITPFVLLNSPAIHRGNSAHTHTHTHSIKEWHSAGKMKQYQAAATQRLLCVSVYLWSCLSVSVFMRDTCSAFMHVMGSFSGPTHFLLENRQQSCRQAWVFPPMWTVEYLMGSSVFSASSSSGRSSFVWTYIGQNPTRHLVGAVREAAIVEVFYSSIKSRRDFPAFFNNSTRICPTAETQYNWLRFFSLC